MLITFLALFFLGTAQGLSIWWAHGLASLLALRGLRQISHYYIFWFLLLICVFFASEPRFSLEYFLLKIGFLGLAISISQRQECSKKFYWMFLVLGLIEALGLCFGERGGLLMWLPVFLSLYFSDPLNSFSKDSLKNEVLRRNPLNKNIKDSLPEPRMNLGSGLKNRRSRIFQWILNNRLVYFSSLALLLAQPKASSLVSLASVILTKIKSRVAFWTLLILCPLIYFSFFESYKHFLSKSLGSRIYIGASCLKGFIHSVIWGHGFGTFAIDIPVFRIIRDLWGSRATQQLAHGHSLFGHYGFELGLIGLGILAWVFVLVYRHARPAFLPLLIISCFDCPLVYPQQFLLAGLIFYPALKNSFKLGEIPFKKITKILITIIAGVVFGISVIGHYYYDKANYERAIFWDRYNSLYHFMQGSYYLNKNTFLSEKYFTEAVRLSPNVGYFYGYLSASLLANNKILPAEAAIKKALKSSGENAYWHVIMAFINLAQNKTDIYEKHMSKAVALNPYIPILLDNPQYGSPDVIGSDAGDIRITSFYRRGEKIFLPLPYVAD